MRSNMLRARPSDSAAAKRIDARSHWQRRNGTRGAAIGLRPRAGCCDRACGLAYVYEIPGVAAAATAAALARIERGMDPQPVVDPEAGVAARLRNVYINHVNRSVLRFEETSRL